MIGELRGEGYNTMVTGQKVRWVLDLMRGTEFAGRQITSYEIVETAEFHDVVLQEAGPGETRRDLTELKTEMLALGDAGRSMRFRLLMTPHRHVLFDSGPVAGFGWAAFTVAEGDASEALVHRADEVSISNEHLRVDVDRRDGTYAIETSDGIELPGLGRLVDGGDGGDTYNYSPPAIDRIVDAPDRVRISAVETGPVRARLRIETDYTWPAFAVGDDVSCSERSERSEAVTVGTILELRPGERFVRITHEFDNRARDHRLRAHFPLPAPVDGSDAECAFTVVHRGLVAEGGAHEYGLPTFPSRRFVDASDGEFGVALLHDGLLEYEVVDDGRALALTLLRATGWLSRSEPSLRPNPAGPPVAVHGARDARRATRAVRGDAAPRRLACGRLLRRRRRVHGAARACARRAARRTAPGCRAGAARRRCGGLRGTPHRGGRTRRARVPYRHRHRTRDHRTRRRAGARLGHRSGRASGRPVRR